MKHLFARIRKTGFLLPAVKGQFYRKSLLLMLSITCLPTIIMGGLFYIFGSANIKEEVSYSNEALLQNALNRMKEDLNQLELTAVQWAYDPRFDGSLRNIDLKQEYSTTQELYRTLVGMKGFNPLIDQVHFYLDGPTPQIVSDQDGIEAVNGYEDQAAYSAIIDRKKKSSFWLNGFPRVNQHDNHEVVLAQKVPGVGEPYGLLVFYLNRDRLVEMVRELSLGKSGHSFIFDEQGNFVVTDKGAGLPEGSPFESALSEQIRRQQTNESGTFLYEWENRTYTVTYGDFSKLGLDWTYVTAASLSSLTAPVQLLSKIIIVISLCGFVLALLLSWLASKRMYSPISRLVSLFRDNRRPGEQNSDEIGFLENEWRHLYKESHELRDKLEKARPGLRSSFLLHLIQGYYYYLNEDELRERMSDFGWTVNGKNFLLILFQVTGLGRQQGRFEENDVQLVSFAAENLAQELMAGLGEEADTINFQDMSVGILLSFNTEEPEETVRSRAFHLVNSLAQASSAVLKFHSTILVGTPMMRITDIPGSLQQLRQVVRYREVREGNQILSLEELLPGLTGDTIPYPFAAEKEVTQAIRMGLKDEVYDAIQLFMETLVREGNKEMFIQDGAVQLLGSIQHAILETGYHPRALYGDDDLYGELRQLREPDQITAWLKNRIVEPYCKTLEREQTIHLRRLVERAMDYMKLTFDSDLSLERCAEHLGTSPFTLSKAFKQVTGSNYIDFLMRLKIDKAKEMLIGTDMMVNEIAQQIGYRPSYLNRLFKKLEGVTPGQYREQAIKKE
ncbi:AraC family transcriptional regulator [Paenibacillus jiagnxiensis]|uniref:AraC family transcriptional regulator n=1 Tax=Paenibacillus jiagnxiensis TaxID=3228926 RepID=UPI0033AB9CAD